MIFLVIYVSAAALVSVDKRIATGLIVTAFLLLEVAFTYTTCMLKKSLRKFEDEIFVNEIKSITT